MVLVCSLRALLPQHCVGLARLRRRDIRARAADIRVDGSSTVFVLSEAVAEEFTKAGHTARVTVGQSGTGGGFQKFCRGETDINDASRPITPSRNRRMQGRRHRVHRDAGRL